MITLFDDVAEELAERGMRSELGGQIFAESNEAGGTVWTTEGTVKATDLDGIIKNALAYGDRTPVNVITGAHGFADGTMRADASMLLVDARRWGSMGASVLDVSNPAHAAAITGALRGPGTTVGAFCNSGICLKPFLP